MTISTEWISARIKSQESVLKAKRENTVSVCLNRRNYSEIELLFQLLRAFTGRFLCNMTFLKEYMEEEIPRNYSIAQKRALFFRFVEFNDPHFNDELKAKVCSELEGQDKYCRGNDLMSCYCR